ncbi:MAG: hypothetical protein VX438_04300 [Planctomycetota bacterium]|nr:hypothetical protein [Planctomycetota bacterium]
MFLTKKTALFMVLGGMFCASFGFSQDEKASVKTDKPEPVNAEPKQEESVEPEPKVESGQSDTPQSQEPAKSAEEPAKSAEEPAKSAEEPAKSAEDKIRPDFNSGKLTFEFKRTAWGEVIRWFADEAKLDLNMAVTPEGSFNYSSNGEFSLLEAMDIINSFLIREQGYILLRHANLIIVHDLNNEIPPTMIETIPLTELDSRGEYELTQTEFEIKGFDGNRFSDDIERLVRDDQGGKQLLIGSSEILFIRETGGRLRLIRKYLEMAKSIAGGRDVGVQIVELKFVTPEEVMTVATELIPLDDENKFENNDDGEQLKVVVQSFGNKFILQGTQKTLARFTDLVEILDKEVEASESTDGLAQPVTKRYPVAADRELILQVLRTMLAGTEGLRLALAEEAGEIIAYGAPEVHQLIEEILVSLQSDATDFEVIRLNDYDADSMIQVLNKMYGITEEEGPLPNQPVFMADPLYSDQIISRAKPTQLKAIKTLVESIDPPIGEGSKYDQNYLQLDLRGKQADMAIELLQDTYGALGRPNKFNVIRSKAASQSTLERIERKEESNGFNQLDRPSIQGIPDLGSGLQPKKSQPGESKPLPPKKPDSGERNSNQPGKSTTQSKPTRSRFINVVAEIPVQDQERPLKSESQAQDDGTAMRQGNIKSVDGAPIMIRENAAGMMIISDDLKALAEIKRLLDENEAILNRPSLPTIVELRHRKAVEMKDLLEMFLGLSSGSSGGGGGGGLGGLVGGMAQNALGGVAGQMVGGLLGGGGGGLDTGVTASDLLTGDVRIDADALKNVLLIQANQIDMDTILEYINYFDTDSPDQDPTLDGRTYTIQVNYRDAVELSEIVKNQFPNRIMTQKSQSQSSSPQAAQMKLLQELMKGGKGGRGGGQKTVQQSEPKMTIGVDAQMNSILVTGPEFLYQQVDFLVKQLDTPDAVRDGTVVVMGLKNITPDGLKAAINSLQEEQAASSSRTSSSRTGSTPGSTSGSSSGSSFNPADFIRQRMQERFGSGGSPFGGSSRGSSSRGGSSRGGSSRGGSSRGGGR